MPLEPKAFKTALTRVLPYKGGKGRPYDSSLEIHKLSSNENPYGCSPLVKKAIEDEILRINEYPDQTDKRLRDALSSHYKGRLKEDQFITGNGGVNIIEIVVNAFLDDSTNCIVSNPCFLPYIQFSKKVNAEVIDIPLHASDYSLDVEGILRAINEETRVVWLCSPNNPTGTIIKRSELETILNGVPDHVVVVYDEVYFHYADDVDNVTALEYVDQGYNVIAINSFSKGYGMAGARIGYAYTTVQIASYINTAKRPFYLNRLSLVGAIAALKDQDFIRKTVRRTHEARLSLYAALDKLNIRYWRTQANFVLIAPEIPSEKFQKGMAELGVMVRPADAFGAPNRVRVTIGTSSNIKAFIKACELVLGRGQE
ncbi:MAG: histidinol-phosphate aminotransferase [Saprospiraceae bacterium]|jgi:histidinol-phosphate aminotransferase